MPQQLTAAEIDLKMILGGILQSLQEAKRLGDLESMRLREVYGKEKPLSDFLVPAFAIGEVELELHFAIVGPVPAKSREKEPPALRISIDATSLKSIDPSHLQVMKLKILPVALRVPEKTEKS